MVLAAPHYSDILKPGKPSYSHIYGHYENSVMGRPETLLPKLPHVDTMKYG